MPSYGTEYADTITDVQGGNTIYAGGGNDLIIAGDEYIEEIIDGGAGMDTISFINLDRINVDIGAVPGRMSAGYAQQTGDYLYSIENVIGTKGGDFIRGNAGANELYGLDGSDVLEGGLGADLLSGGTGNDYAVYENSGARVAVDLATGQGVGGEAAGDRLVSIENVFGSAYDDLLRGSAVTNELRGNGGRDSLYGHDGNDRLSGGNGDDMLDGGRGADQLTGGAGADVFRFTATGDSYAMVGHQDNVRDFNHSEGDKLNFSWIDAKAGQAGEQDFHFIGTAAFTAEGQIRACATSGDIVVEVNTTAQSGAEMSIVLSDISSLTQMDFIF